MHEVVGHATLAQPLDLLVGYEPRRDAVHLREQARVDVRRVRTRAGREADLGPHLGAAVGVLEPTTVAAEARRRRERDERVDDDLATLDGQRVTSLATAKAASGGASSWVSPSVVSAPASRIATSTGGTSYNPRGMMDRFDRLRLDRAAFFVKTLHATKVLAPVRPSQLAQFVRGARQTKVGPHLALMFHAAAHPDKEAVVEYAEHGVRRYTWGELDAAINRLAHALVARGAGAGSRVAIMLPNGSEYLIAQQALARLGATAVQIGYRSKASEIAYILGNAQPSATIVHADYQGAMDDARAQTGKGGPTIVVGGDHAPDADARGTARSRRARPISHRPRAAATAAASSSTRPARRGNRRAPTASGGAPASSRSPT